MRKTLFGGAGRKKFFEVETHGKGYVVRQGKVGEEKKAKTEEKTCKSPQDAEKEAERVLKAKIDAGYFPIEKKDEHAGKPEKPAAAKKEDPKGK